MMRPIMKAWIAYYRVWRVCLGIMLLGYEQDLRYLSASLACVEKLQCENGVGIRLITEKMVLTSSDDNIKAARMAWPSLG